MSTSKSSDLFRLIKALTKAEKRAFKLYAKRSGGNKQLFLKLFDIIDGADTMNDQLIIKKMKLDSSSQFTNLKRHLFSQIMILLRMLSVEKKPNIKIREFIDIAYILYNKGLYMEALNILKSAKQLCNKYGTDFSLLTILEIEKTIHSRHITRLSNENFDILLGETEYISHTIADRVHLSNLKMHLHRMYINQGHVENERELKEITDYFHTQIREIDYVGLGIMERIYYCQCHCWYYFIIDDYRGCYEHAKEWIKNFQSSEDLQRRDYNLYLRGFFYGMISCLNLQLGKEHKALLDELEHFRKSNYAKFNKNNKIFSFLYVHTGRLNQVILEKDYQRGLELIPKTMSRLKRYAKNLDQHKVMVLHFKIAWIHLMAKKPAKALPLLKGIVALNKKSLREDIQSYARLMHLMALYDLENYGGVLDLLRKYRYYFEKAKEINPLQKTTLQYFQDVCNAPIFERKATTKTYLEKLHALKENRFERRAFLYLDIIAWLEN